MLAPRCKGGNTKYFSTFILMVGAMGNSLLAQNATPLMAIGDSLTEGVQSANSFYASQPNTYANRVATQMGVPFQQPLLTTSPIAFIYTDAGRTRIDPTAVPADVGISGATTNDVLTLVANPVPVTEADLVLPPYFGLSQIQIVEQVKPKLILAWVGNDDLIGEVLDFSSLNQPNPTPLPQFTAQYQELVSRLAATGAQVVMSNIPDLTEIGFLFDNDDLTRYTGVNYNFPAGYRTTLPTMVLLKLGVFGPDILKNPAYILTPTQLAGIRAQVQVYNQVISKTAAAAGFPWLTRFRFSIT